MKKSTFRSFIFIVSISILALFISVSQLDSQEDVKKVLFISSYNAGFDTLPAQVEGLNSVFNGMNVILDIEYMDTKRYDSEEHYLNFYNFLKTRLDNGLSYDALIVGDDNGLQFIMDNRLDLFPDTPIVFFCINDLERAIKADNMILMSGIVEGISLDTNIKLATELFPKASRIIGIVDNTTTGLGDASGFMDISKKYPMYEFALLNFSDYTLEAFNDKLAEISKNDIVFLLNMFQDLEGKQLTINQSVEVISQHVKAPVFRMSVNGIGDGLLGGNMVSYEEQGRLAAEMVVDIFNGIDSDQIQLIKESPNKYYFDYEVMRRFGLSLNDVPKDSIIIHKPINFIEENKMILLPTLIVIAILSIFIVILVRNNRILRAKDKQLSESNMELSAMNEEVIATEEEIRDQFELLLLSKKKLDESDKRYRKLAYTDPLTGLNNRTALMKFLDDYVKDDTTEWYLLYIDLDNFKYINDTRGHEIGDEILCQISRRLESFISEVIYLSRLGGDEFVIVLHKNMNYGDSFIQKLMDSIKQSIILGNSTFYITCSIGIASFPEDGFEKNILLRKADMAMYHAKYQGKSNYSHFAEHMELAIADKLIIHNRIRHALVNNEFEIYYQPQYDLMNDVISGAEVLIRWRDANGQFISPAFFIPIAEEQGIIRLIGKWVYSQAFSKAKEWEKSHNTKLSFSVNVSAHELMDDRFAETFINLLDSYDIDASQVAVEITESIFINSKDKVIHQLHILKQRGIEIHLDDFGTGYSSLKYLVDLPLDIIKIDIEFIRNITINEQKKNMTEFIINLAHSIGLSVIAEGVETLEQFQLLKAMQCDKIQGYYFAKPMEFNSLLKFSLDQENWSIHMKHD